MTETIDSLTKTVRKLKQENDHWIQLCSQLAAYSRELESKVWLAEAVTAHRDSLVIDNNKLRRELCQE